MLKVMEILIIDYVFQINASYADVRFVPSALLLSWRSL